MPEGRYARPESEQMLKVASGQAMDEASRAALASGRAEPALGLLIDSLMALRGLSELESESIAGAALEAETPAEMAAGALDRAFAAIDRGGPARPAASAYPELIRLPRVLVDVILSAEAETGWRFAAPGVRKLRLKVGGGESRAEVFRTDPGTAIPWHTHKGQEVTLCLLGGYSDHRGSYGPGDVTLSDPSIRHQPVTDDDGPCFVLTVTDAGLKFEGVLGAIQKLIGG
jgi:putative transcriptional regulator